MRLGVQDSKLDLRRVGLFLGKAPQLEQCSGEDEVRLVEHGTDRIWMDVRLPCRGLVVISETMFPGWEALVDGKAAKVWEAYGVFRSVVVEGGQHQVEFRFRPRAVYFGAVLTLLGLVLVVVSRRF